MKNSSDKWEGEKNLPAPWSIWRERVNAALATKSADPYFDRVRVLTRQLRRAGKGQWGSAKLTGTEGIGRSLPVFDTSEVRDALDLLFFVMKNSPDKWEGEKNLPAPCMWSQSIWIERVNTALITRLRMIHVTKIAV